MKKVIIIVVLNIAFMILGLILHNTFIINGITLNKWYYLVISASLLALCFLSIIFLPGVIVAFVVELIISLYFSFIFPYLFSIKGIYITLACNALIYKNIFLLYLSSFYYCKYTTKFIGFLARRVNLNSLHIYLKKIGVMLFILVVNNIINFIVVSFIFLPVSNYLLFK